MTPALAGLVVAVDPGYATGGVNLLTNGSFDAGGGSLTGWHAMTGGLRLASDGFRGSHAALARVKLGTPPRMYGLTTASPPVTGAPAGETFASVARIRSATPGRTVCLVLRELAPGGATVHLVKQCRTTTAKWSLIPTATLTVQQTGDSISLTVRRSGSSRGDSFEVDSVRLVDTDTSLPSVPAGVQATAPTTSEVDVSWQASTDSGGAGVRGYVVSRDGTEIATLGASATGYSDTTVSASTSYSYTVAAFDFAGNRSADSAAATVTTPSPPPPDNPPSKPLGVTATAISSSQVDVAWNASTDTDATGVAGYTIARDGTTIATVGAGATQWSDTTVSPSTTYSYTVTAFDTANKTSPVSSPAGVTTPAGPASPAVDDLWHLDETTGSTMVDSGQTPHPGVLHNVALGQSGDPAFSGTAYGFNGTSSYVSIPNAADLNPGDRDIRIALSLNTTTVPAVPDYDLFRKGEYPGSEYKLELQPNGQFLCELRTIQADGTLRGYSIQPAIDLHDGQWHRVTCSKVGGTMTVTVDGAAFTRKITGSITNDYDAFVGTFSKSGTGDLYQGLLDEISLHIG